MRIILFLYPHDHCLFFLKHLISIYGCISVSQKEIMSLIVTNHPVQNTNKAGEFDPSSL